MLFGGRFLFLFLFIRSINGLSFEIQEQDTVVEHEIVDRYKKYIETGISLDEKGEVLDSQQKADFIRNILQWMAHFLPNELDNLHANIEKSILYANLLINRENDLVDNIITHDDLRYHNLTCQDFFYRSFELADKETIDERTRIIVRDAYSLYTQLQSKPTTTKVFSNDRPFFSTLKEPVLKKTKPNPIGVLPFTPTQAILIDSRPIFPNITPPTSQISSAIGLLPFTPAPETSIRSRPLFTSPSSINNNVNQIRVSDYPMTDFIVKKIKENNNLTPKKLKILETNIDLLKIVENLSGSVLENKCKNLFREFNFQLTQKNITNHLKKKYTANLLNSAFWSSFIKPLKNTDAIKKDGNNLVPNQSLPESQKNMIKWIIKWRNVFDVSSKNTPKPIAPIFDGAKYPRANFIVTKIKENNKLSPKQLKILEKNFYLLEIVEDLSDSSLECNDQDLFKNFNDELNMKNIASITREELTASTLNSIFYSFIKHLKKQKLIISDGVRLVPSKDLSEEHSNMIKQVIKWRNVFFNTNQQIKKGGIQGNIN